MPSPLEDKEKNLSSSVMEKIDFNMEIVSNEMKWSERQRATMEVHRHDGNSPLQIHGKWMP